MIKIVCLFNRKPGLSLAEFKDYYETKHVPLVNRLLPPAREYRRNYAMEGRDYASAHLDRPRGHERPFDVITEVSFDDERHYQQMVDALADPQIRSLIAQDEEKFLDRPMMRTFFVDERS